MAQPPPVRHVVFHRPGPNWEPGVEFREQPGLGDHVSHYAALHQQGRLEFGGPFVDEAGGGMMMATEDVTPAEIEQIAASDPAVQSGLLSFEIRPWYVAMERRQ